MTAPIPTESARPGPRLRHLGAALVAAGLVVFALPASALDLLQTYQRALAHDPAYRAAFYTAEAGKENAVIGRAGLLPQVTANVNANKNKSDITSGNRAPVPQDYNSHSAVLQVRQPLLDAARWAEYRQGRAQSDYAMAQLATQTQEVILRAASAYLEVLYRQEHLALAKVQRDVLTEQLKVNERLFAKGEGVKTELLETQARLDVAEAALLEAGDELKTARDVLAGVIGGEVGEVKGLRPDFRPGPAAAQSFDDWLANALQRNPSLEALRFGVEVARQEVAKRRAGHYPRLELVAQYAKQDSETINTINTKSETRSIGFQLNVPLYAGGAVSASTRQAVAGQSRARAELDAQRDKVVTELRREFNLVTSSTARINALVKAVESSTLLIKATEQSIKGGVRINLDLLNAQQQLYTNKRDLAQARFNYLLSTLRLKAAGGTLSEGDVREMSAQFQ